MSATQIESLRKDRTKKITGLRAELDKIKKEDMYSPEYKQQKTREVNQEIESLQAEYDQQITSLISETRNKTLKSFDEAEFAGMQQGDEVKALIKEMRNKDLADDLVNTHRSSDGEMLRSEAERLVKSGLSSAPAYIKAMKQLNISGADSLGQEYKNQTMNSLQKGYKSQLDEIEQQEKAYEIDKTADTDPLRAGIMSKAYGVAQEA